jgi:hydroxyacylglutathione hydrolase
MKRTNWMQRIAIPSAMVLASGMVALHGQTTKSDPNIKNDTIASATKIVSWFTAKTVADKVWRIDDHGSDNMYLVEGKDKALLIDTGTGVGDLLGFVKSLTKLPIVVVNTHGHPDHAGGNFQFQEVYAHSADFELIQRFTEKANRDSSAQRALRSAPEMAKTILMEVNDYQTPAPISIKDGYVFDLGGRQLKVIEVDGHTPGSICLLDAENHLLFTGDNDNTLVWLFLADSLPIETYLKSLENLKQTAGILNTMLPGHGDPIDGAFLNEQIVCCKQILDGTCKGETYHSFVGDALKCSYKRASVAFNPENLFEKK